MDSLSNACSDFSDSLINKNTSDVNYRFSGYQLPRIQLDETGPGYVVGGVHPYFTTQPTFWEKPSYQSSPMICRGEAGSEFVTNVPPNFDQQIQAQENSQQIKEFESPSEPPLPSSSPKLFKLNPLNS